MSPVGGLLGSGLAYGVSWTLCEGGLCCFATAGAVAGADRRSRCVAGDEIREGTSAALGGRGVILIRDGRGTVGAGLNAACERRRSAGRYLLTGSIDVIGQVGRAAATSEPEQAEGDTQEARAHGRGG
jgi:hypothetical protein